MEDSVNRHSVECSGTLPDAADASDDFLHGICVALTVVTSMDCGVTWAEIVRTAGENDMLQYAAFVEPEEWVLAGFAKYALGELHRGKPRKNWIARRARQNKQPVTPQ